MGAIWSLVWAEKEEDIHGIIDRLGNVAEEDVHTVTEDIKDLRNDPQKTLEAFQTFGHDDLEEDGEPYKPDLQPPPSWNNVDLFERMPPGFTIKQPKSFEDLLDIIKTAAKASIPMKAVGTCYAYSEISFTSGYVIEMNRYLHRILYLDSGLLKDSCDENVTSLCTVEGGCTIQTVNDHLWPPFDRENGSEPSAFRTILNQTGTPRLSIGGTISTGSHGSGIDKPTLPDMVESLHLITVNENHDVIQYCIEPKNGISDPQKFRAKHGEKIILLQDDDVFYSCVVSMGCMGVIYSMTLRVQPGFFLEEKVWKQSWDDTKKQLPTLIADNRKPRQKGSLHSFKIWVNPYPVFDLGSRKWEINSVITTYTWSSPPKKNKRPGSFETPLWQNELLRKAMVFACKNIPFIIPEIIELYLRGKVEDEPVNMPSTEALYSGSDNTNKVVTSECAMDASSPDLIIEHTETLIQLLQDIRKKDKHQFANAPLELRLTRAAKAYLAQEYGRDTLTIETPILLGTPKARDTLRQINTTMVTKCDGRPHWGQINDLQRDVIEKLYPDTYQKFMTVYKRFNCTGLFDNEFTKAAFN